MIIEAAASVSQHPAASMKAQANEFPATTLADMYDKLLVGDVQPAACEGGLGCGR
jgi:hypothetical protein